MEKNSLNYSREKFVNGKSPKLMMNNCSGLFINSGLDFNINNNMEIL